MENSEGADALSTAARQLWGLVDQLNSNTTAESRSAVRSLARIAETLRHSLGGRPADELAIMAKQNIQSLAVAIESEASSTPDEETAAALQSIAAQIRYALEQGGR